MPIDDPKAADDGLQSLVVGQLKMLAPELPHLPHPAAVGCAIEQSFDEQGLVVTGNEGGKRIAVLDAVGGQERKMRRRRRSQPCLFQALKEGEGLRADKVGIDKVRISEASAGLHMPFDLVIVRRNALRP